MADTNTDPKLPNDATTEIGVSGTLIYSGIITQEEYNLNLKGRYGNQKFEIMRRSDSTVRGALQVCKLPILSTSWEVKPALLAEDENEEVLQAAKDKAGFIERELFHRNVDWHDFIRQSLNMFDFGFSLFEKVFELTEFNGQTRIGLAKLASRKQVSIYSWNTGEDDKPGVTQMIGIDKRYIPREKLVLFTNDREGDNHEGVSLLRYIYKDWDIKDKLTLVNAMALEKLGVGVPIVSGNPNSQETPTPDDEQAAIEALSNMRANQKSYLKVPKTMQVEMLDLKGNTTKDIIPTLEYHDSRIMKSVLAGFLELGGHGSGSQALSKDLTSLFMKSEEAAANVIKATVMNDVVKQLCDLNFTDMSEGYPQLSFGSISDDDITTLSAAVNQMMTAGALTPDAALEDHLRTVARLPNLTKEQKENYVENHQPVVAAPTVLPELPPTPKGKKDVNAAVLAASRYRRQLIGMMAEG